MTRNLPALAADLNPKLSWYIARSSGMVCWLLLAASLVWGLLLSARILNRHTAPGWLLDLHRYLGAASIVFTGIHIAGLVGDNWLHVGWGEVLVPMRSTWRPGAVAWGVVSFYVLLAIEITSLVKARIPRRVWRMTHYLSFPLFVASTIHSLQAGTDVAVRIAQWAAIVVITVVAVQVAIRVVTTRGARDRKAERGLPARTAPAASARAASAAAARRRSQEPVDDGVADAGRRRTLHDETVEPELVSLP